MTETITIRPATSQDEPALRRLAELDSQPPPQGETLLAFVDGELRAALPSSREALADPFRSTRAVIELLRAYATGAQPTTRHSSRARRVLRLRTA